MRRGYRRMGVTLFCQLFGGQALHYLNLSIQELLKLKPDFPSHGRILIGHYIKFDEIIERTIEGLRIVGGDGGRRK